MKKHDSCQALEHLAARFSKSSCPNQTNFNNTKSGKYFLKRNSHIKDSDGVTVNSQSVSTIKINFNSIGTSRPSSIFIVNENEVIIPFGNKVDVIEEIKDSFSPSGIITNPSTCSGTIRVLTSF